MCLVFETGESVYLSIVKFYNLLAIFVLVCKLVLLQPFRDAKMQAMHNAHSNGGFSLALIANLQAFDLIRRREQQIAKYCKMQCGTKRRMVQSISETLMIYY